MPAALVPSHLSWEDFIGWVNADRYVAIGGVVVTVIGVGITVWQIRAQGAVRAAERRGAARSLATVRGITLGRLVRESLLLGAALTAYRRLNDPWAKGLRGPMDQWSHRAGDIASLVNKSRDLKDAEKSRAINALGAVSGQIDALRDSLDARRLPGFRGAEVQPLREAVRTYETVMSELNLSLEDAEVTRHDE